MFCPVCSQQQVSNDTRFCSRCGFLLTGVSHLIASGGAPQGLMRTTPVKMSERKRGVKQGAVLFFSGMMIVPLLMIIAVVTHAGPVVPMIAAILTFLGGFLRMIYALLFESGNVEAVDESIIPAFVGKMKSSERKELPADITASPNYDPPIVNWRDTNDLMAPPSITDQTTRSLYKDK